MKLSFKKVNKLLATVAVSLFFITNLTQPALARTKCTSSEISLYKKAKTQFVNDNSIIYLANKIKAIVEDARQQKSELLGRYVDYTNKDIYTLEKQDQSIRDAQAHRDTWEPTLRKLAKKCSLPMPSRSEVNPGTE